MEQIKKWLNGGGTYAQGVALFLRHSSDPGLRQLFTAETESDFKRKMLRQELSKLLQVGVKVDPPAPARSQDRHGDPGTATVASKTPGRWSAKGMRDQVESEMHQAWQAGWLEMKNLQARIYEVAKQGVKDPQKKDEAAKMAHRILELSRSCRDLYRKRDQYFLHGSVADETDCRQYAVDPIIAHKEWKNAERYVRQMRANLKRNPDDDKSRKLLEKHQAAVDHYKKFFKIDA